VKKKGSLTPKDKKDWAEYIKDPIGIFDKESKNSKRINKSRYKFDLHGYSLSKANVKVKEIICLCHKKGYSEVIFITGKGLHSNKDYNIYESEKLSTLRYSVPNFIKNEASLLSIVKSIEFAAKDEGGEGALLVKLRL
tara:strand:+ start:160 stop:573 length:414 start_codon:yes stop_codon:yes gene_type:complete